MKKKIGDVLTVGGKPRVCGDVKYDGEELPIIFWKHTGQNGWAVSTDNKKWYLAKWDGARLWFGDRASFSNERELSASGAAFSISTSLSAQNPIDELNMKVRDGQEEVNRLFQEIRISKKIYEGLIHKDCGEY